MAFILRRNPITGATELIDAVLDASIASIRATGEAAKAVIDEICDDICSEVQREIFIFPDDTSRVCTITAGAPANTWGAWAEVTDSLATTFSSKITALTHITMALPESVTDRAETYFLELSYGAARINIARRRFSPDRELGVIGVDMYGKLIPIGEIVYARMMCTGAGESANIVIRYHYHV